MANKKKTQKRRQNRTQKKRNTRAGKKQRRRTAAKQRGGDINGKMDPHEIPFPFTLKIIYEYESAPGVPKISYQEYNTKDELVEEANKYKQPIPTEYFGSIMYTVYDKNRIKESRT